MAYKMRQRALGLQVEVSDSNSKSPALKRPIGNVPGANLLHKDSPLKEVWFIRHGESEHNASADWGIRDPGLTEAGWKQAKSLKNEPLLKGALGYYDPFEIYEGLRMQAISNQVPIVAVSDLQETSDSPCDTGHPAHLLEAEFPEVDFTGVAEDWFNKKAKWNQLTADRMTRFCEWLARRPERRIVCIGHLDFIHKLLGIRLRNCGVAKYEFSKDGWAQKAVADVSKSIIRHWINGVEAKDNKWSHSRIISQTKEYFIKPNVVIGSPSRDQDGAHAAEDPHLGASWLKQVTAKQKHHKDDAESPENVAKVLFNDVLAHAGYAGETTVIDRKLLTSTMIELGYEIGAVQQLVSQITSASRARKAIAELNLVDASDFITTVCLEQFWKIRLLALRKHMSLREVVPEAPEPQPPRPPSRYSAHAGIGALLMTPGPDDGSLPEGPRELALDRLRTPTHKLRTLPTPTPAPKDRNDLEHLRESSAVVGGSKGAHPDAAGQPSVIHSAPGRAPTSFSASSSVSYRHGRPTSALSLAHSSAGDVFSGDTAPLPQPSSLSLHAGDDPASTRRSYATATPLLSKRLGLHLSVCLDDDVSESADSAAGHTGSGASGSRDSTSLSAPLSAAPRHADRMPKDSLRVNVSTPATVRCSSAAPTRSSRRDSSISSPSKREVTSPKYNLPRQSNTRQVSINLDESPPRYLPPSSTTRSLKPLSARPKSALRFLAEDPDEAERERERLAQQQRLSAAYLAKCQGLIEGVSKCVVTVEKAVVGVSRGRMQSTDAARRELVRLMAELDAERQTNQRLAHEVEAKNRKIQELTAALRTEQGSPDKTSLAMRVGEQVKRAQVLRFPVTRQ